MKIVKQTVSLIDSMGSDLSVVNAARVSFAKESEWERIDEARAERGEVIYWDEKLSEKDAKLVSYLAKHNHWSPFAHAFLSFRIKAPIFVARQLVKHQVGLAWNEVSRRYVDDEPEFYTPDYWRGKPVNAKQGSSDHAIVSLGTDMWCEPIDPYRCFYDSVASALSTYNALIAGGVAPEQARMVLPQNTMTEWVWSGSLAAFARVCKLRLDAHAQAETREIAQLIQNQVPNTFKHSWQSLSQ